VSAELVRHFAWRGLRSPGGVFAERVAAGRAPVLRRPRRPRTLRRENQHPDKPGGRSRQAGVDQAL
jgi:hypothetical protein